MPSGGGRLAAVSRPANPPRRPGTRLRAPIRPASALNAHPAGGPQRARPADRQPDQPRPALRGGASTGVGTVSTARSAALQQVGQGVIGAPQRSCGPSWRPESPAGRPAGPPAALRARHPRSAPPEGRSALRVVYSRSVSPRPCSAHQRPGGARSGLASTIHVRLIAARQPAISADQRLDVPSAACLDRSGGPSVVHQPVHGPTPV